MAIDSGWAAFGLETLTLLVALAAGYSRMNTRINGFGLRLKQYEADCNRMEGELKQLSLQFSEILALSHRVSVHDGRIVELNDSLTETKLLLVAQVGEVKNTISDKNGVLGERIARLEPKSGGGNV